jgi:hypothetical protein
MTGITGSARGQFCPLDISPVKECDEEYVLVYVVNITPQIHVRKCSTYSDSFRDGSSSHCVCPVLELNQ